MELSYTLWYISYHGLDIFITNFLDAEKGVTLCSEEEQFLLILHLE